MSEGEHAESWEPKTWEPPAPTCTGNTGNTYNGKKKKRDPNKGELLQLPKEAFEIL